ncbi:MAG: hypothetical protein ACRYG4_24605 [Janthinobacterium lividum]
MRRIRPPAVVRATVGAQIAGTTIDTNRSTDAASRDQPSHRGGPLQAADTPGPAPVRREALDRLRHRSVPAARRDRIAISSDRLAYASGVSLTLGGLLGFVALTAGLLVHP